MSKLLIKNILQEICQEINDISEQYWSQLELCLKQSLLFIQRENFNFNKLLWMYFYTIAGQDYYSLDQTFLSDVNEITLFDNNLEKNISIEHLVFEKQNKKDIIFGKPEIVSFIHEQKTQFKDGDFYIFPMPDKIYKLKFKNFYYPYLSLQMYDETEWLKKVYNLLYSHSRYLFFRDYLQDKDLAALSYQRYQEILIQEIKIDYIQKTKNKIIATRF